MTSSPHDSSIRKGIRGILVVLSGQVLLAAVMCIVCRAEVLVTSLVVSNGTVVLGITNTAPLGHFSIERSFGLEYQPKPSAESWALLSNTWHEVAEFSNSESFAKSSFQQTNDHHRAFYRAALLSSPYRMDSNFAITTPYVTESDIKHVWGYNADHDGTDFETITDGVPFCAVCDGEITARVLLHDFNPYLNTNTWYVIVVQKYNHQFSILYGFEPATADGSEGIAQWTNISVTVGQTVRQGDIIGRLHVPRADLQVNTPCLHFGLMLFNDRSVPYGYTDTNGQTSVFSAYPGVWPKPYFTPVAWNSFSNLYILSGQELWD